MIVFDFYDKIYVSQNQTEIIKKETLLSVDTTICNKMSFLGKTKSYCMQWSLIDFNTGYRTKRKDEERILIHDKNQK